MQFPMRRAIRERPRSAAVIAALLLCFVVRFVIPGGGAKASVPGDYPSAGDPHVPAGFFSGEGNPAEPEANRASAVSPLYERDAVEPIAHVGIEALDRELQSDLEALVGKWFQTASSASKGKLSGEGTQISVHVRELSSGNTLASIKGERILRPASNLKVATSAAALLLLGSWGGGEYQTAFEGAGEVSGGLLRGDLVVHAGGDPLVSTGSLGATENRLDEVAHALKKAGVNRISGDLVLNEGTFLVPGIGPAWPSSNQHWDDYCARAAGLTINGGVLVAQVAPSKSGAKAHVQVHPTPHGLRNNYSISTVAGAANDVRVGATTSSVTVKGKIGTKAGTIVSDFSHPDPVGMFGAVLWDRLARGGIQIDGSVVRRRGPPPGGNVIFTLTSPISDSLVPINTNSNNGVADQLFFALGHRVVNEGSREGASRAVKRAFEIVGVDPTGHVQVDGSGLSRDNRISPNQLTGLLHAVLFGLIDSDPVSQEFLDSLAVMGESGTLSSRMRGTAGEGRIFAKTGFIDGTSSLSGIVITEDGVGVVFSIIVNYQTLGGLNNKAWKPMQDAMVLRMLKL